MTFNTKICKSCNIEKSLDEFIKADGKHRSTRNRCKDCSKIHSKLRIKLRKENIPPSSGYCPLCNNFTEKWVLDHNHKTFKFRGYICRDCNAGLGLLKDDINVLKKAINYLSESEFK
jgi:hypothetical protein